MLVNTSVHEAEKDAKQGLCAQSREIRMEGRRLVSTVVTHEEQRKEEEDISAYEIILSESPDIWVLCTYCFQMPALFARDSDCQGKENDGRTPAPRKAAQEACYLHQASIVGQERETHSQTKPQ